jgi:hypothetical protein
MSSFVSGGSAAASTAKPFIRSPNQICVSVAVNPKAKETLKRNTKELFEDFLLLQVGCGSEPGPVTCEITVFSEKLVEAILTLEKPESLDKVKNYLKTKFQVEIIQNKKEQMRKPSSVVVVQPKKGDKYVDPKSLLPDFDPEILEARKKSFGAGITYKEGVYSSFLRMDFLTCSGLFGSPYGIPYLKPPYGPVKDTRRVMVYSQKDTLGTGQDNMRIAHPDCPGITEKCLNMCKRWTSDLPTQPYEHGYVCMGMMDMPVVFLNTREFWLQGL